MTISRPTEMGAGDEVRLGDRTATVVAVTGTGMQLQDITGQQFTITRGELLASPGFQVITGEDSASSPVRPAGRHPRGSSGESPLVGTAHRRGPDGGFPGDG